MLPTSPWVLGVYTRVRQLLQHLLRIIPFLLGYWEGFLTGAVDYGIGSNLR